MIVTSNSNNEISKCSYIAHNIFTKGIYKCSMTFVFRKTEIPSKTRQIKRCNNSVKFPGKYRCKVMLDISYALIGFGKQHL